MKKILFVTRLHSTLKAISSKFILRLKINVSRFFVKYFLSEVRSLQKSFEKTWCSQNELLTLLTVV